MALEDLVSKTRAALKERAQDQDISTYIRQDRPSNRSLEKALSGKRLGYILQCARALPYGERTTADFDAAALAGTFAPFADAVSFSTSQAHFDENRQKFGAIRNAVDAPVVCNDVVVDPYQIYEARYFGADAITLMPSVVEADVFEKCVSVARSLEVDVIGVVQDEDDLEQVLAEDIAIVGIDNRDFDHGEFDLLTSQRLAPKIPDDRIKLAIGGLRNHREVIGLRGEVDAVLTGDSLVESGDVPRALRELVFGRVKVCGLVRGEDAEAAWEAGATYGGLIFAPGSAREVTYDQARSITASAPLRFVGVFVDDSIDDIACCAENLGLSAVQLHGQETNDDILELRRRLPKKTEIWKAVHAQGQLPRISAIHADRVLLDNFEHATSGADKIFDWSLLDDLDDHSRERLILGGGLTADNAARADAFSTWGLDVNLGVESSGRVKSRPLMDRFFSELRGTRRDQKGDS